MGGLFAPTPAPASAFGPAPAPAGGDIFGNSWGTPAPAPAPSTDFFAAPAAADPFGAPAPAPGGDIFGGSGNLWGAPAPAPAPANAFAPAPANDLWGGGGGGDVFGSGGGGGPPRDPDQAKWPRAEDMRGTIYGCAWFSNEMLLVGDAAGDMKCIRVARGGRFQTSVSLNVQAPIVSIACHAKLPAGVFTSDPKGNVRQWDLRSKKDKARGALGQALAMDFQSGVLVAGSWAKHIAVLDVRNNGSPQKIALPGKCHCVDVNGNMIYAGVNKDPQNIAVMLFDRRNTSKPFKTWKVDPRQGLIRCIMRRGNQGGFMYGTRNGYVGLNINGHNQPTTTDLATVFRTTGQRSPSLMVSSIAFNPTDKRTYVAVSNGRILKEQSGNFVGIKFASSTSLSRIAFSAGHMAVCRSYNFFDHGQSLRAGKSYKYNEVFVRDLKGRKK